MDFQHRSVLLEAVLSLLDPKPGEVMLDGTAGGGGHAVAIAARLLPGGFLWALDTDPTAVGVARARLAAVTDRFDVRQANFRTLGELTKDGSIPPLDGILLDLGVSSHQLDTAERGFSFSKDAPLDMRLNPTEGPTAAELVNTLSADALADIIFRYGEERANRAIGRAIVEARKLKPIETTAELAAIVAKVVGHAGKIHPATRTFQALRIAVNEELTSLETVLPDAISALKPGGRLAVISFHSLEDRIVKETLRTEATDCICPPRMP
ncbi:MAG: 16S rRNA (cytosine(1402)-N(4))-methyltransferase RsmH, partial [Candidatus Sericytochromatia bacterium]|nr:16S rRNA (cytosine(1402)-N(4))-methyltransferase RsmH [Candidatus Sericytochromatia bacterium]